MIIGRPTVEVPTWPLMEDAEEAYSLFSPHLSDGGGVSRGGGSRDLVAALRRFLPSNRSDLLDDDEEDGGDAADSPVDAYSSDHFRMYEFKVRNCTRGRSHDWTACPFAHPGEKARRRDPRKYHYSGASCPEFRKGTCRKGEACEFAHGVFECWLHPARYRTQPCKDGLNCRRRVCFFAHKPEQLRVITTQTQSPRGGGVSDFYELSPLKQAIEASCAARSLPFLASPSSIPLDDLDSPPPSPMTHQSHLSRSLGSSSSVSDTVSSLRNLQMGKVKSFASSVPSYGSPRGSALRPICFSLPTTPTGTPNLNRFGYSDMWESMVCKEEEPSMERVESGRGLRARMFERLSRENPLETGRPDPEECPNRVAPDVEWVSELLT
ncbi:hypothetical protein SAY87_002096 [Trapa incisa]|uniref:C3H1-type domain-containing protein n=1 Tax=Trapa incisa TaxID=236973 RepID=A0AAN7PTH0_9MYRT|nr:hypothetical protein SAY87_002096 [Trapa incisa]